MCPQDNPETNRYFVICMRRSFVEVSQSYARAVKDKDGKPLKWEIKDEATHDAQFAAAVEILECRNDCDVVVWDYGEVIADPLRHFNTVPGLQQPRAAAKIPDKNKRTFLGGFTFSIVSEQAVGNS